MNYSLFDVLDVINFESGIIRFRRIKNPQFKDQILESSRLFKLWWFMWRLTPKASTVEFVFSKLFGGHITIGNLTFFGCNAMMFAFELDTKQGFWLFRPPCFNLFHRKFTWGRLYLSPDGTPRHPKAKNYYGSTEETTSEVVAAIF